MPELRRALADHDLALLRLVASLWGLELTSGSQREAADELAGLMLAPGLAAEITGGLPPGARAGLEALAREGRLPLAQFARRYGELRAMGPARRERERPWANDPSDAEILWYRGLIGRAFFDDGRGPEEFVFIADDLRPLISPAVSDLSQPAAGGPAPQPPAWASTGCMAADDAVTLLAYLQAAPVQLEAEALPERSRQAVGRYLRLPVAAGLLLHLVQRLGMVQAAAGAPLKLVPERAQPFLQAPCAARTRLLAEAWRDSGEWNDLRCLPGLVFDGSAWRNDPCTAREAVLRLLAGVPAGAWWSLDEFVLGVKERQPDYQRPAGDYDSWYIRDAASGAYLRGFQHWERIDGALVRWLIANPLHWLGLADLSDPAGAFRLTPLGAAFLEQAAWDALPPEPPPAAIELAADGRVRVPRAASAYDRFQMARITDWAPLEADDDEAYGYRLSPAALARAARKGISVDRVLAFLQRAAAGQPALPALARALRRWQRNGLEASLSHLPVLKLSDADLLDRLRREPLLRDLLGETLGPNVVGVPPERLPALRAALAELGILLDE
jgi:hypothetical protein